MNLVVKEIQPRCTFWIHDDRKWCWAKSCVLQFICLVFFFFDPQKCVNINPWSKHKSYCRTLTCCMFFSLQEHPLLGESAGILQDAGWENRESKERQPFSGASLDVFAKKLLLNDIMEVNPVTAANLCQVRTQQMTTWYLKTASICHVRPTSEVI